MRSIWAALAIVWAAGVAQAQAPAGEPLGPARAAIESGPLLGAAYADAHVFRNVPYAAPPVGPLRWAPPRPAGTWTAPREATFAGPSCPQPMNANGSPNLGGANGPVSEDCLQLNVFAPKAARKAPVMVWLHGGGHRTGAGWVFDGQAFARDGVIVVTINYRLGPFGYLAHPALTRAAGGEPTGNFGLMDQIAALKWVQRNIGAFGGDPGNVTVFGESAGAASTLALLATPAAKGLYHKAIVQSGGGWSPPVTLADKEKADAAALAKAGVPANATADDLRALPMETLIPVEADYGPFVDGRLLRQTPAQAFARGVANDVPLIIGTNSGEDSLLGPARQGPDAEADRQARDLYADRYWAAPARWIARKAAAGRPAWLYHFSYIGGRFRPAMTRAAHAAEIQYVFEYWGRRTPMSVVTAEDRAMAALMHGCWVAFAKTGAPCSDWPKYDPRTDRLMEFGSPGGVRTHFRKPQLDAAEAAALDSLKLGR